MSIEHAPFPAHVGALTSLGSQNIAHGATSLAVDSRGRFLFATIGATASTLVSVPFSTPTLGTPLSATASARPRSVCVSP